MRILTFFLSLFLIQTSIYCQELVNSINCARVGDESVVSITVKNRYGGYDGSGSGVLISYDGKIVTNYHVYSGVNRENNEILDIDYSKKIIVNHQGNIFTMKSILYESKDEDLLIFSVGDISSDINFKPISIGNVSEIVKGQTIYAIGNTFGQYQNDNRITQGIISSNRRSMIEFSASINDGNSGGALINDKCQLVGIVTQKDSKTENIGFAIPINIVKNVISKINGFKPYYSPKPIQPIPQDEDLRGTVMLYLSSSSEEGISVFYNNNKIGVLNVLFYEKPKICNQLGTVTFKVPKGKHTVDLYKNSVKIKSLTFNLPDNRCYAHSIHIEKKISEKKYDFTPYKKRQIPLKKDTDLDGVPDDKDLCPYRYGSKYNNGCPPSLKVKASFNIGIGYGNVNDFKIKNNYLARNTGSFTNYLNIQLGLGLYFDMPTYDKEKSLFTPYIILNGASSKEIKFDHQLSNGGNGFAVTIGVNPEIGFRLYAMQNNDFFFNISTSYYIPYLSRFKYFSDDIELGKNWNKLSEKQIDTQGFSFSCGIGYNFINTKNVKLAFQLDYNHDIAPYFQPVETSGIESNSIGTLGLSFIIMK